MSIPISVQLYTVREEIEKDFIGTLEKIATMGYDGVEFAGFGDIPASKMKMELERLGLKASGSHVGEELLRENLEDIINYHLELGVEYIVCCYATWATKSDLDEFIEFCRVVGLKCKEKGITFCFHNHAPEFECIDGKYKLDILYNSVPKEFLQVELDTFWVKYANVDPVNYISKYSGRIPLVHIKDMENEETKDFTEVGSGIMDIKSIIDASVKAGTKWLVVEQDVCKRPCLESIKISIDNLRNKILK